MTLGFGEVARADRHIRALAFMVCPVTCPRPYSYLKTVCERWLRYFVLFFGGGLIKALATAAVGERIREQYELLKERGRTLAWNEGNHFREPDIRAARAFVWRVDKIEKTK